MVNHTGRLLTVALAFALSGLTGCATLTTGTDQTVEVMTEPEGAACTFTRNGETIGVVDPTPGTLNVAKANADILVRCTKPGYLDNTGKVGSAFQAWTFGNILFGGLIGVFIDIASGATSEYEPRVHITMIPQQFASAADRDVFFDRMKALLADETRVVRERVQQSCQGSECQRQLELAQLEEQKSLARLEEQRKAAIIGAAPPPASRAAPSAAPVVLDDLKGLLDAK